jgi:hypothetical protein
MNKLEDFLWRSNLSTVRSVLSKRTIWLPLLPHLHLWHRVSLVYWQELTVEDQIEMDFEEH